MSHATRIIRFVALCCLVARSAQPQDIAPPARIFSIGQPPLRLWYADALAVRTDGALRGAMMLTGLERSLFNPVVGLASVAGEVYGLGGSSTGGEAGLRAIAKSPALALGAGVDWNVTRGRVDALFTYRSAILRGGLLGHGTMLRVDWLPWRDHTFAFGIEVPLNHPLAGRTRPKHLDVSLPEVRRPEGMDARLPAPIERELARIEQGAQAIRVCSSIWSEQDVRDTPKTSTCSELADNYDDARVRAFTSAAGGDSSMGRTLDAHARTSLYHDVVLPYDTMFAQVKDPTGNIDGLLGSAYASYQRWLSDSSAAPAPVQATALATYARVLGTIARVHTALLAQWNDSRYVWLPMRLAKVPSEYDDQRKLDALIGEAVGHPFTDGNAIAYLQSRDLPLEIARSIFAAREYHVLWTHDVTSRRHGTHNLDNVGYEMVADAYFPAMTEAVKRYDETGRWPVYMIFLDQYFYEPRGGRLWMTMLDDPLNVKISLPGENEEREQHLRQRQAELRAAVAASRRLQADAARLGGSKWLAQTIKVHVNITDPSDFSFRSDKIVPPFSFAPDNLMRDHRKIVIYDLDEADPYRGALLMMGTGVGEQFASATWEDRGIRVRGPATLEARIALQRVMQNNTFRDTDIPEPLRVQRSARPSTPDSLEFIGRALQVHNEVGWGAKKASIARAIMYDLALPGSTIIAPDPQWVSEPWGAMLTGAAVRGAQVFVIAPALANAPTPDPSLQSLAHDVMLHMLELGKTLEQPLRTSRGALRVGLFAGKAEVTDPAGRRAEVRAGLVRYPWLHALFPFDSATAAYLEASEARAAVDPNATAIARDEVDRAPKMHQKTQLVARPGSIAALLRQPGWYEALGNITDVQAQETAELTGTLGAALPVTDTSTARRTDLMLHHFEQAMRVQDRAKLSFHFSVGTMNQDPRGMSLDGEAIVVTSGFAGAAGFVDLYNLMARSTWVADKAELERLLPAGSRFKNFLARLIWPTM